MHKKSFANSLRRDLENVGIWIKTTDCTPPALVRGLRESSYGKSAFKRRKIQLQIEKCGSAKRWAIIFSAPSICTAVKNPRNKNEIPALHFIVCGDWKHKINSAQSRTSKFSPCDWSFCYSPQNQCMHIKSVWNRFRMNLRSKHERNQFYLRFCFSFLSVYVVLQ